MEKNSRAESGCQEARKAFAAGRAAAGDLARAFGVDEDDYPVLSEAHHEFGPAGPAPDPGPDDPRIMNDPVKWLDMDSFRDGDATLDKQKMDIYDLAEALGEGDLDLDGLDPWVAHALVNGALKVCLGIKMIRIALNMIPLEATQS